MQATIGLVIWLAIAAFEIWAANQKPQWTLSEVVRRIFHTRSTTIGRITFAAIWIATAAWFLYHILEP